MRYLKLAIVLSLLWLMLSGHFSPLLLSLGLFSVLLVTWLIYRLDNSDDSPVQMIFNVQFLLFLGWLLWRILLANIDVARRIWDPSLPINPAWRRIRVKLNHPVSKTLYANAITLTPGTLTTDTGDGYFVIHGLDEQGIADLELGEMEARIARLEHKT